MTRQPDVSGIDVRYVADLARIELTDDEVERFESQLEDVLEYVNKLGRLDVDDIEPMAHTIPLTNVMREDEPRPGLDRDAMLANAPATADDEFIRVPPVIEDEGIA